MLLNYYMALYKKHNHKNNKFSLKLDSSSSLCLHVLFGTEISWNLVLSLACSAARPTMAGYVEAWVLPRYPLLVWNVQVSLDNTPPLEAAQDLMGGPLAGNDA